MIFLIIIPLLIAVFANSLSLDPDLGWHLRLGQAIVEKKGMITNLVGFNYFAPLRTTDHEWLSNLLFYGINKWLGYPGLMILFGIIFLVTLWLAWRIAGNYLKSQKAVLFLLVIALLSFSISFGVRVQFLLIFATLWLLYIKIFINSPWWRAIFYAITTLVINNLHGGFITLLPIVFLLELDIFHQKIPRRAKIYQYATVVLAALLPVVANPNGWRYLHLLFAYSDKYYQLHIAEFLPIFSFPITMKILTAFIPLSVMIFLFTINGYWKKLRYFEIILLLFYGYLGIRYIRQFPIFISLLLPFAAQATADLQKMTGKNRLVAESVAWFSGLLVFCYFIPALVNSPGLIPAGFNSNFYPQQAANFVSQNHPVNGNFLNPYNWGGYLTWTHPELQIYMDGRGPADNGMPILKEYNNFYSDDQATITTNLKKYDISYILVQKPSIYSAYDMWLLSVIDKKGYQKMGKNNLIDYLQDNDEWQKVYEDPISLAYFKKTQN